MNLLILEPASGGHHLSSYVRHLVREALRRDWKPCLVTTPESRAHSAFGMLRSEFGSALQCVTGPSLSAGQRPGRLGLVRRQAELFAWHRAAIAAARRAVPADMAMIMSFDGIDRMVAVRGSPAGGLPFASISIGVRYHWPRFGIAAARRQDALDRRLFERAIRQRELRRLFVIDETYAEYAADRGGAIAARVAWIPDPGEVETLVERSRARETLGIAFDAFTILVYGQIGLGKGIRELLHAVAEAVKHGGRFTVVIAGKCGDDVRELLRTGLARELEKKHALLVRDRFHSASDEALVFGAADVVWVAYSPAFLKRSAVMCQAASAGRPTIARDKGLVGRCVARHGIGATISGDDVKEITGLLKSLGQRPESMEAWIRNAHAFAEAHTGAAFGRAVCDGLRTGLQEARV